MNYKQHMDVVFLQYMYNPDSYAIETTLCRKNCQVDGFPDTITMESIYTRRRVQFKITDVKGERGLYHSNKVKQPLIVTFI